MSRFIDCAYESMPFAGSQNEESDFAAERRWENEGGNPGQLQQSLCDDRKEDTITGLARDTLKVATKVNDTCI